MDTERAAAPEYLKIKGPGPHRIHLKVTRMPDYTLDVFKIRIGCFVKGKQYEIFRYGALLDLAALYGTALYNQGSFYSVMEQICKKDWDGDVGYKFLHTSAEAAYRYMISEDYRHTYHNESELFV